jgi:REP element-mobilizing transposase RayT
MLNHIHVIIGSHDCSGFVRDFKRHTSSQIRKNLQATEPATLGLFENGEVFGLWEKTSMPLKIESYAYFRQKVAYIHYNPVKKHYVELPEHWLYSSANPKERLRLATLDDYPWGS